MIYDGNDLSDLTAIVARTVSELGRKDIQSRYDFIAVRGMSGVLVGSPASILLQKRLVIVRKPGENSHGSQLVGVGHNKPLEYGERFIFLDDFISTGATQRAVIEAIPQRCIYVGDYLYDPSDIARRIRL